MRWEGWDGMISHMLVYSPNAYRARARSLAHSLGLPHVQQGPKHLSHHACVPQCLQKLESGVQL